MSDPKPTVPRENLLTNHRDNESSLEDIDITTSDDDSFDQDPVLDTDQSHYDLNFGQGRPASDANDLSLVEEDGQEKGKEDLGYTR